MNLWRLQCFIALAIELHFGRAARRLHLSQPALSQQIRQFESELGVELVIRTGGVQLTEAGRLLFEEGKQLLDEVENLVGRVRTFSGELTGQLRVAYNRSVPVELGVNILRHFRRLHPRVEVTSQTMWTSYNVESIRDNLADIAFLRFPILTSPDLETVTLGGNEQLLVMRSTHELAKRDIIDRTAMPPVVMVPWNRDDGPGAYEYVFGGWEGGPITWANPEPDFARRIAEAEYLDAVTIIHDFLVSIVPETMVVRPIDPPLTSQYGIAWRKGSTNPVIAAFIASAREVTGSSRDADLS